MWMLTFAFITGTVGVMAVHKQRSNEELCPDGSPRANVPVPPGHDKSVCCNLADRGMWWQKPMVPIEFWGCQCEENHANLVVIERLHYAVLAGNVVLALLCVPTNVC